MSISLTEMIVKCSYAIRRKKILLVKYLRKQNGEIIVRRQAPVDYGTTDPNTQNMEKDSIFMWCYDHIDEKTGKMNPTFHSVKDYLIVSMEETEATFDENELADKIFQKTGWDYRTRGFAFLPDRKWFRS
jgi:hypothetical protein